MSDNKRLAFSIIQFLQEQVRSGDLSSGAQESLEGETWLNALRSIGPRQSYRKYAGFPGICHMLCFSWLTRAVAVQCLETAFEVSTDDQSLAVPMSLPEIFTSATSKVQADQSPGLSSSSNPGALQFYSTALCVCVCVCGVASS